MLGALVYGKMYNVLTYLSGWSWFRYRGRLISLRREWAYQEVSIVWSLKGIVGLVFKMDEDF